MATNQPSASESRSTGGTRSRYDVMLVWGLTHEGTRFAESHHGMGEILMKIGQ